MTSKHSYILSTAKISTDADESLIGIFDSIPAAKAAAELAASTIGEPVAPWFDADDDTWQLGGIDARDHYWMVRAMPDYEELYAMVEYRVGKKSDAWRKSDWSAIEAAAKEVAKEFCGELVTGRDDPLGWEIGGQPVKFATK